MKKNLLSVLTLFFAFSLLFAGGAKDEGAAQGVTTVRIALWDYDVAGSVYPALFAEFEKANPDIKIEVVNAPANDYETKLTTMLASGDSIDVFFAKSNTSYPTVVEMDFAKDLNPLIKKYNYDVKPYGTVLKQHYEINGGLYALPFRTNDWVLYYNKNMFDKAGLPYPTNDMTWEKFFETGKKLSHGDEYGSAFYPKPGFIVPVLIGAVDGFDISVSDFNLLVPAAKKVKAAMDEGAWEKFAESVSLSKDQTFFFHGKWGMFYDGSWFTQMLEARKDLGFKYGIVKSPYWAGTAKKGFATSTPVLMSSTTKKESAAWRLITGICGAEGAKIVAKSMLVPGYMSSDIMNTFKESTKLDESSMKALTNNVSYGLGAASVNLAKLSAAFNQELESFLTNNQSAEKMAENLNKRRVEILKK
ncbi:ABC transporter substrate-binding protein [Treponema parvum]|uniref:ABC transporter substrate-binding protein n=1 Tax=Treponema parvum TaxID=138851 RepID=UPI001AEC5D04|nr:extracellular solute-binding protein [Treponema parvum]QTQ16837.1 extracellular solute-binding protein [Treponema parvum]